MTAEPDRTVSPDKEFRILALSGGGYLGVYTAALLADLEERVGEPLGRRFDLIAGTSVGGILAIGLGYELPMRQMLALFLERGRQVFSPRALPRGTMSRLIDLTRSVLGPKYLRGTCLLSFRQNQRRVVCRWRPFLRRTRSGGLA